MQLGVLEPLPSKAELSHNLPGKVPFGALILRDQGGQWPNVLVPLHREWYGPQSPLLCPELKEDILDSLYALNGVSFSLDLQRPDLDEAWPMFSE